MRSDAKSKDLLMSALLVLAACGPAQSDAPKAAAPEPETAQGPAPLTPSGSQPAAPPGDTADVAPIDPEKEYSAAYSACLETGDAANGVTPAMAACVHEELARQDDRLNAAYQSAMSRLPAPEQASLRQAQRAWIKTRDASCLEGLTGGTIDQIEVPGCHLSMTAVRAVELERMR